MIVILAWVSDRSGLSELSVKNAQNAGSSASPVKDAQAYVWLGIYQLSL